MSSIFEDKGVLLSQKKNGTQTNFLFRADAVTYTVQDGSGSRTFACDYEDIPFEISEMQERNVWLRNVGVVWLLLGAVISIYEYVAFNRPYISVWLIVGAVCYIIYYFRRTSYTIFDTPKGRIFIIRDKTHDTIKQEIETRRRGVYRKKYAHIDSASDPERETAKLKWLLEHDIITRQECDEMHVKLQLGLPENE
jgi:hypothetical protein